MAERASFKNTLHALEDIRDVNLSDPNLSPEGAGAGHAVFDHVMRTMLDLADAVKRAANGDVRPAAHLAIELRLDEVDIRP